MKLALHLPINSVSFGQVSTVILRTLYEREQQGKSNLDLALFPIGQIDFSSQKVDEGFGKWLQAKINVAFSQHSRHTPIFKLWHLNGSLESYSNKQTLFTFYELDQPTLIELNIARNSKVCLSSQYARDVFRMFGVDTHYLPVGFDSYNFSVVNKKFHSDDRIVFNMCGKLERRKHHAKCLRAWIKKFGRNPKYALHCATYNTFLNEQQNNDAIRQVIGGDKPFNVVFYPFMKENAIYNEFLNAGHIIIGMSGGEGWGLPEFNSIALGKHGVILNAHSYKSWVTEEMATLVQPTGKITAVDNFFFRQGDAFNQGQIFDFNDDAFIAACEEAIKKYEANPVNTAGLKLQEEYSKEKFVDNIIHLATS